MATISTALLAHMERFARLVLPSPTRTVLIADENRALCRAVESAVAGEGFTVRTAFDALGVLAELASALPDLMILDANLPMMNGLAVIRVARARGFHVPVVLLSALAFVSPPPSAVAVMSKPFDLDRLLAVVRREIAHPRPRSRRDRGGATDATSEAWRNALKERIAAQIDQATAAQDRAWALREASRTACRLLAQVRAPRNDAKIVGSSAASDGLAAERRRTVEAVERVLATPAVGRNT
jgi:DNA-binding response OmpR family regulator